MGYDQRVSGDPARTLDLEFPNLPPDVVEGYRSTPEHLVAEIIAGELSLLPRPRRRRHARGATRLAGKLVGFDDPGEGDPGGWVILAEPELRLGPHPDILVPDIGGWRRERVPPDFLDEGDGLTLAPDWCCEVLSPSTERLDRGRKLDVYHRERIGHVWLVSFALRTLEVYRWADLGWLLVATFAEADVVCAEPFDAVPLDLAGLWAL